MNCQAFSKNPCTQGKSHHHHHCHQMHIKWSKCKIVTYSQPSKQFACNLYRKIVLRTLFDSPCNWTIKWTRPSANQCCDKLMSPSPINVSSSWLPMSTWGQIEWFGGGKKSDFTSKVAVLCSKSNLRLWGCIIVGCFFTHCQGHVIWQWWVDGRHPSLLGTSGSLLQDISEISVSRLPHTCDVDYSVCYSQRWCH